MTREGYTPEQTQAAFWMNKVTEKETWCAKLCALGPRRYAQANDDLRRRYVSCGSESIMRPEVRPAMRDAVSHANDMSKTSACGYPSSGDPVEVLILQGVISWSTALKVLEEGLECSFCGVSRELHMYGKKALKYVKDGWGVECSVCRAGAALRKYWEDGNYKLYGPPKVKDFAREQWFLAHVYPLEGE